MKLITEDVPPVTCSGHCFRVLITRRTKWALPDRVLPCGQESHAFLGKCATSPSASGGRRITLSRHLATYSLVVLKRGLAFERKDASPFLKDITRLSVARGSPGILHKDMCVSSGAGRQAGRLPSLSAHLPHAGQGPSSCQARAAGTLLRGKDSHCSCPSSGHPA